MFNNLEQSLRTQTTEGIIMFLNKQRSIRIKQTKNKPGRKIKW